MATTGKKRKARTYKKANKRSKIEEVKKIETFVPESKLFMELVAIDQHMDEVMHRKHLEIRDAVKSKKIPQVLQFVVYNTYSNQGARYNTDGDNENTFSDPPSWCLRIEGHVFDSRNVPNGLDQQIEPVADRKFTSVFKKIVIQLDPDIYPEDNIIEWQQNSQKQRAEKTGVEVRRVGGREQEVCLYLFPSYSPPRYKLSSPLSSILRLHTETRSCVMVELWKYIRVHNLQDPNDRKSIILNKELKEIFGMERAQFSQIPELLREHLGPPDPVEIKYTIKLSGSPKENAKTYNLEVFDDSPKKITLANEKSQKKLEELDLQVKANLEKLKKHRKARDFMKCFSNDPTAFLHHLVASQVHDSNVAANANFEESARTAAFYQQPIIDEAISNYLAHT